MAESLREAARLALAGASLALAMPLALGQPLTVALRHRLPLALALPLSECEGEGLPVRQDEAVGNSVTVGVAGGEAESVKEGVGVGASEAVALWQCEALPLGEAVPLRVPLAQPEPLRSWLRERVSEGEVE